jgi:hypothetical protein
MLWLFDVFITIWYIYANLLHLCTLWSIGILSRFGMLYPEKSGNTGHGASSFANSNGLKVHEAYVYAVTFQRSVNQNENRLLLS